MGDVVDFRLKGKVEKVRQAYRHGCELVWSLIPEGECRWECRCGSVTFKINPVEIYCAFCGEKFADMDQV